MSDRALLEALDAYFLRFSDITKEEAEFLAGVRISWWQRVLDCFRG